MQHKDRIDRPLNVGDCVAYSNGGHMSIGIIDKLNNKMVRVRPLRSKSTYHRYPFDVVLLQGPEVTIYLLKNSSD